MNKVKVRRKADGAIFFMTRKAYDLLPNKSRNFQLLDVQEQEVKAPTKKKDAEPVDHKEIVFEKPSIDVSAFEPIAEDVDDIEALRTEYLELSGKKSVDKRWKEDRLKEEINKLK